MKLQVKPIIIETVKQSKKNVEKWLMKLKISGRVAQGAGAVEYTDCISAKE